MSTAPRPAWEMPAAARLAALPSSSQRRARLTDVEAIRSITDHYARTGILLPRTNEEIAAAIATFRVAELEGVVCGMAALRSYGDGIGELRSLAVMERAQGHGLGGMLVHAILADARAAGISDLYVLTANPGYFARHGFAEVHWATVPAALDADRPSGIARRRWNVAMVLRLA